MTERLSLPEALVQVMAEESGSVLILDRELRILEMNKSCREGLASAQLAAPDGDLAPLVGRSYLEVARGEMGRRLGEAFAVLARRGPGPASIWLHSECNTSTQVQKLTTRLTSLWLSGSSSEPSGYLVQHSVRVEGPLAARYQLTEADPEGYRDFQGLIVQCSCCRRVAEPMTGRWVMNLALLEHAVPGISHGLCALCLETYYAEPIVAQPQLPS